MRLIALTFLLLILAAPARADEADALRNDLTVALKGLQESRVKSEEDRAKRVQELNARVLARQQQRADNEAHNSKVRAERMATRDAQKQATNESNLPYYLRTIPVQ